MEASSIRNFLVDFQSPPRHQAIGAQNVPENRFDQESTKLEMEKNCDEDVDDEKLGKIAWGNLKINFHCRSQNRNKSYPECGVDSNPRDCVEAFTSPPRQPPTIHIDSMQLLLNANLESISISIWVGGVDGSTALLQLKDVIVKAKISHSWW